MYKSCRQNILSTRSSYQANMPPSSILPLVLPSSLSSFFGTCYHSTYVFMFFHFPSVSSCLHNIFFFQTFSHPSCLFPHHVSPLSYLFFALSDLAHDSSDEDSEEEEDFARVQFGSRYTAARCVFVCACSAHCMFQWAQEAFH